MGRIRRAVTAVAIVTGTLAVPLLGRADAGQLSNEAQCRATYLSQATNLPPGSPVSISNGVITIDTNWVATVVPVVTGDALAAASYAGCVYLYSTDCALSNSSWLFPLPDSIPIPSVTNEGGVIAVHYGPTVDWAQLAAPFVQQHGGCVATP